jgi:hypothetical protein
MRTGQTKASFASGAQTYLVNLCDNLFASNTFQSLFSGGVPLYEYCRISSFTITWYPALIIPVSGTFEPEAFDLRFQKTTASASSLPTSFSGNYNQAQYSVLLQQTATPRVWRNNLNTESYLSEQNLPSIGMNMNLYACSQANPNSFGGSLLLIQTQSSVNTVASYNPKLGFVEIKYELELLNSIV